MPVVPNPQGGGEETSLIAREEIEEDVNGTFQFVIL